MIKPRKKNSNLTIWGLESVLLRKRKGEGNWNNREGLLSEKDVTPNL